MSQFSRYPPAIDVSTAISGDVLVDIRAEDGDSVKISDGTNAVTTTTVSAKHGLDVAIVAGGVTGTLQPQGLSTALRQKHVTITDVATKIPATALTDRNTMTIRVIGANTVYLGSSTVVSTLGHADGGYPKYQNEEFAVDIQASAAVDLYGICETGKTCIVAILEFG